MAQRIWILFVATALAAPVEAAIFTVTNTAEQGHGSLRQAILDANANAGPDDINFAPALAAQEIRLNVTEGPLPTITDDVTITGAGAGPQKTIIDGGLIFITGNGNTNVGDPWSAVNSGGIVPNPGSRIFVVDDGNAGTTIDVIIRQLRLEHGAGSVPGSGPTTDLGGAIYNAENLTVENVSIDQSFHRDGGGAIWNDGTVTIRNCTIANCGLDPNILPIGMVYTEGGHIIIESSDLLQSKDGPCVMNAGSGGSVLIRDSSIRKCDGSGVTTFGGTLDVVNSSLFSSRADGNQLRGGGIHATETNVRITNATLYDNSVPTLGQPMAFGGDQLYVSEGTLEITNTLLSQFQNLPTLNDDFFTPAGAPTTINVNQNNFAGDGSLPAALSGDPLMQVPVFPHYTPMTGNTASYWPQPGSPLIDAGNNALAVDPVSNVALTTDQIGNNRISPGGGTVDIGAIEIVQPPLPAPALELEKDTNGEDADVPPGPGLRVGDDAIFTYLVRNTGNVDFPLGSITLTDDQGLVPTLMGGDDGDNVLEPGEIWHYEATTTVTAGPYANIANVTAMGAMGGPAMATDSSNHFGFDPEVELQSFIEGDDADLPPGQTYMAGTPLTFTYTLENTGNEALVISLFRDDNATPADASDDFTPTLLTNGNGDATLDPGETWTYTAARSAVVGQHDHVASAVLDPAGPGFSTSDTDPHSYNALAALGTECSDAAECFSGNCADGVCCDALCDGEYEACNIPRQVGTCRATGPAPAPAASGLALLVGLLAVALVAARALKARSAS